jgi:hypothetical protein
MIASALRRAPLALLGSAALLLAGCSAQGVTVSGKVIFPPAAKLVDSDAAQITFLPEAPAAAGKSSAVKIAMDGSFTCSDLLPGKYKLVVNLMPYPGSRDQAKRKALFDRLDRTYDAQHSKLIDEVARAPQQITVDLVQGTVTKN